MSGMFGIVSENDCATKLLYGTDYHSHMGTQFGGMAVLGQRFHHSIHDISRSQFKSKFFEEYKAMDGHLGIGVISDRDAQPLIIGSKFGTFAIASVGLIHNADDLASDLLRKGAAFSEMSSGAINSVEVIAKLINEGESLVEGILAFYERIEGSASLLIMKEEGIYAVRDRLGRTPLVVGERDGEYVVATESLSFLNLGYRITRFLEPGEIVRMGRNGLETLVPGRRDNRICSFLWIYTGYPASSYEGVNVEASRYRCGAKLADRDRGQLNIDCVAGIPDSGTGHALGYANPHDNCDRDSNTHAHRYRHRDQCSSNGHCYRNGHCHCHCLADRHFNGDSH